MSLTQSGAMINILGDQGTLWEKYGTHPSQMNMHTHRHNFAPRDPIK